MSPVAEAALNSPHDNPHDSPHDKSPHDPDAPIQPVAFRPLDGTGRPLRRLTLRPLPLGLLAGVLLAGAALALLLGAQGVRIETVPADARVRLDDAFALHWGTRWLLRPGSYQLSASAPGYRPLSQVLEVTDAAGQQLALTLEPLPGHLMLTTTPVGAAVSVDGAARGTAPLTVRDLPAGRHRLEVTLPRHQPVAREFEIEGRDRTQELAVELAPAWGRVQVDSVPGGARISVAGQPAGATPAAVDVVAGEELVLELPGYRPWRKRIEIAPGAALDLGQIPLALPAATLTVTSVPAGAELTLDGRHQGRTPLTLAVEPDQSHQVVLFLRGHADASRSVRLRSGARDQLEVRLEARAAPAPAALPGVAAANNAIPSATSTGAGLPMTIEAPGGGTLRLFRPEGTFTLGSGRREQGRRADQVERQVQLQRPFYLAVHEVTNAQFRRFQRGHSSSHAGGKTLDLVRQPVVKVSWSEAARFCNWLSREAGLKPFYQESGGAIAGVDATATGYRLPTEAEWEWAARSESGSGRRTFPWGDAFPPPAASENIAGQEAAELVAGHLATLDDGFAVSAPVGSFPANARGLADLGGNVAEWVHDFYEVPLPDAAPARDPLGPARGSAHVIRGPSWRHGGLVELRLAYRDQGAAGRDDVGFRFARYAE